MFRSLRGASACGRVSPSVCLSRIRSPLADRATYLYVRALLVVVCRLAPACRTRCVWEACAGPASVRATSARVLRYVDLPNLPFMAISSLLPLSYFLWRVLHLTVTIDVGPGAESQNWGPASVIEVPPPEPSVRGGRPCAVEADAVNVENGRHAHLRHTRRKRSGSQFWDR